MTVYDPPASHLQPGIRVATLLQDEALGLKWQLLTGKAGLDRLVSHPRIQKSGLALVGHMHGLVPSRVQVMGETELSYIESLPVKEQSKAAGFLFHAKPSCVVVSRGVQVPATLVAEAHASGTPLVLVDEKSSVAITAIHTVLDEHLAPRARLHGVLVDIFEVGVLLCGQSGIGKSECALELVMRGHRLVADDVVECDYRPPGMIFGEPADPLRHFMEVRGLGILNMKDLYGVTSVRDRKRIDIIVDLEMWKADSVYDRIGVEDQHRDILGVPIRAVTVPIQPGRNMSSIIEIAARAELLRRAGHHPARDFIDRIERSSHAPLPSESQRAPVARTRNESSAPPPAHSYEGRELASLTRKTEHE